MSDLPLVNHIQPLAEWLSTYPPFASYVDSMHHGLATNNMTGADRLEEFGGSMHIIDYNPDAGEGAHMLQNVGANFTANYEDILGKMIMSAEVQFMLFARRRGGTTADNMWRREGAEFLAHLCQWAEIEWILGRQPKFGNYEEDREKIVIAGGMPWQRVEHRTDLVDFMWQLNFAYKLDLSKKD